MLFFALRSGHWVRAIVTDAAQLPRTGRVEVALESRNRGTRGSNERRNSVCGGRGRLAVAPRWHAPHPIAGYVFIIWFLTILPRVK